jgi:branched-chain amino acid transport system permease protein
MIGIAIIIMILVHFFFEHTITGKAMMAVAFNKRAASLMGINPRRMVIYSFIISSATGAISGIIITPVTLMAYDKGAMLGLKGFCAAMLGGFGSIPGAIIGGFLLGIFESFGSGFISSAYKDAIAFLVLLAVLLFRPKGILGRK